MQSTVFLARRETDLVIIKSIFPALLSVSIGFEKYSGVDERVWGNEILHVLKGARMFSQYDIAPIIEQIREKQRILIENYPDEFGPHKWSFDLDEWMAEEYLSGRPTYYSKAITEKRDAELRELYDKRGQTNG